MRLAEKLFDLRQYPESLNEFEQVTKIFSQSATAYNNMGNIYLLLNQNEKSIESLKQALAINPEFVAALTNLGRTYQKIGRNREAVEHSKIAENLFTKANNSFMMTQAKMNLDLYNKKYRPPVNGDPK